MSSEWSVSVEFPGRPTRSGPPVVKEPCANFTGTEVSPSGGTTVQIFAEADNEEHARERGLLVANKVAQSLGLPTTPQNVTVELQRTFL